jgi:hypothetical protein
MKNVPATSALTLRDDTVCGIMSPYLPSSCTCAEGGGGGTITCSIDLLVDTFTFVGDFLPCALPASMKFDIKGADLGLDCCTSSLPGADECCAS